MFLWNIIVFGGIFLHKRMIIILAVIVLVTVGIFAAAFSGRNMSLGTFPGIDAAEKIRNAQKQGAEVKLNSSELNGLLKVYLKNGINKGSLTVKGIQCSIQDNKISFKAPCSFNGIKMILQSKGSLNYDGDYTYVPDYFRIGKLPIPKSMVFNMINKYKNGNIYISNNAIKINRRVIPLDVKNLSIKEDNIIINIQKYVTKGLFEDKASILNGIKKELTELQAKSVSDAEKQKIQGVLNEISGASAGNVNSQFINKVSAELNDIAKAAESDDAKKKAEDIKEKILSTDDSKKKQALSKVSGELQSAAASLTTSGQRQVVYMMQSTIRRMISNPSYSYGGDEGAVRAQYSKLSPEEKKALKAAIFSNVDTGTLADLRSAFGL